VVGLPSFYYSSWFFGYGYNRYPHLYEHYHSYYYNHRSTYTNVYRGFNSESRRHFSSTQDYSNSVVVRAQRATLQYWKETVPWAAKGSVSVANAGDLAKEAGLFPWLAVTPDNASP